MLFSAVSLQVVFLRQTFCDSGSRFGCRKSWSYWNFFEPVETGDPHVPDAAQQTSIFMSHASVSWLVFFSVSVKTVFGSGSFALFLYKLWPILVSFWWLASHSSAIVPSGSPLWLTQQWMVWSHWCTSTSELDRWCFWRLFKDRSFNFCHQFSFCDHIKVGCPHSCGP